ncbi:MAG: hypothetical protein WCS03_04805 [Bacteroidota bacterium]
MSKRISLILLSIIGILAIAGCNATKIPRAYLPNPNKLKTSITGSWIEVTIRSDTSSIKTDLSGELIAIQNDTLFILSDVQLNAIKVTNIDEAILYIFKNQGGRFAIYTGLSIVPDIIGAIAYAVPGFLILGVPILVTGSVIAIVEGGNKSNRLFYPERNSIKELGKFARFPAGMAPEVRRDELILVKTIY